MNQEKKPFIIWTLQRTGGTNLTKQLMILSGLPGAEHEPFNIGRVYGHISQSWTKNQDSQALDAMIENVVAKRQVIKHCVETVPWKISQSLARASTRAGYRHLFLHRRNAVDRLLSLHFAQKSGIWGPNMQVFIDTTGAREADAQVDPGHVSDAIFTESLPVEKLLEHERNCRERLMAVWQLLCEYDAEPLVLAYEDIYRNSDFEQTLSIMMPVLRTLRLMNDEAQIRSWTAELVGEGDQGTRDKYQNFPGMTDLIERVKNMMPFQPNRRHIHWRPLQFQHPWIERFFIDVYPQIVEAGQSIELGGVLVLTQQAPDGLALKLKSSAGEQDLQWGIESQRMKKEHPEGKNAGQARWRGFVRFINQTNSFVITLLTSKGEYLPVGEISEAIPENINLISKH